MSTIDPNLPLPTITQPKTKFTRVVSLLTSHFLKFICFWKWFQGSKLTERQITVLRSQAEEKIIPAEQTFKRFQDLLKKKIALVVKTVNARHIADTLQSAKTTLVDLPEHFNFLLDLANHLTEGCGKKSPFVDLVTQPAIIKDTALTRELLAWLIPHSREPEWHTPITQEVRAYFSDGRAIQAEPLVSNISAWLFASDRSQNLLDYLETKIPGLKQKNPKDKEADIHRVFGLYLNALFQLKKTDHETRLKELTPELIERLITRTFEQSAETITNIVSARLVQVFKDMEPDFSKTFDALVAELQHLLEKGLASSTPQATFVGNKELFLRSLEAKAYDSMASAVLEALFPRGLDELEAHFQLPKEFADLFENSKKITEFLLPKDFVTSSNSYVIGLLSTVLGGRSTFISNTLKKGLAEAFKSIVSMFSDPKEQAALMTDSILPSVNDTLKKTFIKQFLTANNALFAVLMTQLKDNKIDEEAVVSQLFARFKQHSISITEREEFKRLLIPFIEKNRALVDKLSEGLPEPLNARQLLSAFNYQGEPDSENLTPSHPTPYLGLVYSLLHNFTGFGRFVQWILNLNFTRNGIERALLKSLSPYRKSPAGILEDTLTAMDESLTSDKIEALINDEPLETLQKKQATLIAEIEKLKEEKSRLETDQPTSNQTRVDYQIKHLNLQIAKIQAKVEGLEPKIKEKEEKKSRLEKEDNTSKVALLIQNLSQTLFDIVFCNLRAVGGTPLVFIAKIGLGINQSYLHSVISNVYARALGRSQTVKDTLHKVLSVFIRQINPKTELKTAPNAAEANALSESSFDLKGVIALPASDPAVAPPTIPAVAEPLSSSSVTGSVAEGIKEAIKTFIDHLVTLVNQEFIQPNLESLDANSQFGLEQLNALPKFLMALTGETSQTQIKLLKQVDISCALSAELNVLLDQLVYTSDLNKAIELAKMVENDEDFKRALAEIPSREKEDSAKYTKVILNWLFTFHNERTNRNPLGEDPILVPSLQEHLALQLKAESIDPVLAQKIYETSLHFIIAARSKQIVDYTKSSMQDALKHRLDQTLKAKGQVVVRIVNARIDLLISSVTQRYTEVFDKTATIVHETLVANRHLRESLGDNFTDQEFENRFIDQKACHPIFKKYAEGLAKAKDRDPLAVKKILLTTHYHTRASKVIEALFPGNAQNPDGVLLMIRELNLDQDVRDWLAPIKELIAPFLTQESLDLLEQKQKALLEACQSMMANYLRKLLIESISNAIKQSIDTLSPNFIQQQLSQSVLPNLQENLLKAMLKEVFLMNLNSSFWKTGFAPSIAEIVNSHKEHGEVREQLMLGLYKELQKALPNFTIQSEQHRRLANTFIDDILAICREKLPGSSEEPSVEEISSIIRHHFAPRVNEENEVKLISSSTAHQVTTPPQDVYGELVFAILKAGQVGRVVESLTSLESVKRKINSTICEVLGEVRSSPLLVLSSLKSALDSSVAKEEHVREMIAGAVKNPEALRRAHNKLVERRKKVEALKNDPKLEDHDKALLENDLARSDFEIDQVRQRIAAVSTKDEEIQKSKIQALYNLPEEIMKTSQIVYDYLKFLPSILTKDRNFTVRLATGQLTSRLTDLLIGENPEHLFGILNRLITETLLSKGIVTESTLMRVIDEVLKSLENPSSHTPSLSV